MNRNKATGYSFHQKYSISTQITYGKIKLQLNVKMNYALYYVALYCYLIFSDYSFFFTSFSVLNLK